ncbi:MAG: alpha/beta fold hydrolase [Pseudomonadota bacterium]
MATSSEKRRPKLASLGPDEAPEVAPTSKSAANEAHTAAPRPEDARRPIAPSSLAAADPADGDDIDPSLQMAEALDRSFHYMLSRFTLGLSPMALASAEMDWLMHLAMSPGKQLQLVQKATRKWTRLATHIAHCLAGNNDTEPCVTPLAQDKRFSAEAWQHPPYSIIYQSFLLQQQWWHNAVTGIPGMSKLNQRRLDFLTRQQLDLWSPSIFLATNPLLLERTVSEGGMNLVRGARNMIEDWERAINSRPPVGTEAFEAGRNLAVTPGRVVYRNHLIELIQYAPTTDAVRPEPVLVVPAWIMKYYVLDLAPGRSLVEHLVGQGFTVFMISWRNPGANDRDLSFDDYRRLGVMAALDAVGKIVPEAKVHAAGYCLGGTLLAIAAAAMARERDNRLASLTFLAAQTDFTEAGELTLFIDESQLSFLEDIMWEQGFLDASQMAGAFQVLRSNDLIWSRVVNDYLMGERRPMTDLMAWNADSTRMPSRMHGEYLRQLFLDNELAEGRFKVDERPIALTDIRVPVMAVGTEADHVAPWGSVFKFHLLLDTELTFLLASGGHNTGIVAPPDTRRAHYRLATKAEADRYIDPETWIALNTPRPGSWWSPWVDWLDGHSGRTAPLPPMGAPEHGLPPLDDAPGRYVRMR